MPPHTQQRNLVLKRSKGGVLKIKDDEARTAHTHYGSGQRLQVAGAKRGLRINIKIFW